MPWSFSFQLMPGETILEDTSLEGKELIKPAYSVFLTDRRVIFRFDGLGSNLCKTFLYREILDAQPTTRLFIEYLRVRTFTKEELFNVHGAAYLADRIRELKDEYSGEEEGAPAVPGSFSPKKQMLHDMLLTLRKNGLLTEDEFQEKVSLLDSLKF